MKGKKKGNASFLDHYKKFELALDILPDACNPLSNGGFTDSRFTSMGFITQLIANYKVRKRVFFADFTQDSKSIERPSDVDGVLLENAVDEFPSLMPDEICS
jgi:hypothetical protein